MTAPPHAPRITKRAQPLIYLTAAAVGGVLLGASGRQRRGKVFMQLAGLALLGIAARPLVVSGVRRAGQRRRQLALRSTMEIERSIAEVFAFFKDFENFPRVLGALRSVIDYQDGRSHWEMYTPSGKVSTWDAVVTKYVPNSVIAWQSLPRSPVDTHGLVRFTMLSPTRTRIVIEIAFRPVRTDLPDAVRALIAPKPANRFHTALEQTRDYLESLPPVAVEPAATETPTAAG